MVDVVIAGAGLGGLALALFSARRGHSATVLERDAPPAAAATAEEDFRHWERAGVPHGRQGHAFLALSTRVLRQEAPDVIAALKARGAMEVPIEPGSADTNLLCRRMVYEAVLRRLAEAEAGVDIRSGAVVRGLCVRGEHDGVPAVVGVRVGDEEIPADLVVDATGRSSKAVDWLAAIGARPPVERAQPCGFSYLTRHFRLRDGEDFPVAAVPIVAELEYATALVFPGDNGRFQLSTTVAAGDPLRHRLLDPEVFDRFLAAVPQMRRWLACGEPTDDPRPMARLENRLRRLVDDRGPVVSGFALLADAAMQTNPTFGRGVSLAFRHAQGLADRLDRIGADPVGWVSAFDAWTLAELGFWFELQLATDTARMRELESARRGEPAVPATDVVGRFLAAMAVMREDDPDVRSASDRVYNMLMTPRELMADRVLSRRILAFVRANPGLVRPRTGPGRAEFERLARSR